MSHKKRIKEKLRHNVSPNYRMFGKFRNWAVVRLYRFARALGVKKRIWYITTSKHVKFDPKQGHLYKTDKEIAFFGTEAEMYKKLDITPNASTATDITNEKLSTYFCLN